MDFKEKDQLDEQLDSAIQKFEKRQKKSFWRGSILSAIIIALIGLMIYYVFQDIKRKRTEKAIIENELSEVTDSLIQQKKNTVIIAKKASDLIDHTTNKENLPDSVQVEYEETRAILDNVLSKRILEVGDTLYVWANSGLTIRQKPDINSESFEEKLNYGHMVIVGSRFIHNKYIDSLKINGDTKIPISGNWLKIKDKGFVFDGYLSRLPFVPNNNSLEGFTEKANLLFKDNTISVKDFDSKRLIKINGLNFNEVFLLLRHLYKMNNESKIHKYTHKDNMHTFIDNKQRIDIEGYGLNYNITITNTKS